MRNWERSFDADKGFGTRHGYGMLFVVLKETELYTSEIEDAKSWHSTPKRSKRSQTIQDTFSD